ncbi:MAG TPA: DUF3662 and FHA domain-containing protein [Acidimicrobiales bacterium]|nr:DUF3662 and FHA domain-containing protein [Acidimicrobiales bacterium]
MGLQQFERRLERLVEGAFSKAFRGELQPVEIGRRLTREMDLQRTVSVRGLIAPNVFDVVLSRQDYERFGNFVEVLGRELVDAAKEHAKSERYLFVGPVEVSVGWDPELAANSFDIASEVKEGAEVPTNWVVLPDGRRVGIASETVTIGRLPECAIVLTDPNASRRHAQLKLEGDAVMLTDLGSTNGTKVNGVRVRQQRLGNGDKITIGTTTLRFEVG